MSLCDWVKEAYKAEWPTMINNLVSNGLALGAAALASKFTSEYTTSDEW
jgi:type II secretory pathway predicted ATPase ExeA